MLPFLTHDIVTLPGNVNEDATDAMESAAKSGNVTTSFVKSVYSALTDGIGLSVVPATFQTTSKTLLLVTNEYDEGPIVLQESCKVFVTDTPETLSKRVREIELRLLPEAIQLFADKVLPHN